MNEQGEREVSGSWSAMSVNDYQRMRRGYERGIAPEALEQIGAQESNSQDGVSVQTSRRVVRITPEPYVATHSYPTYAPQEYSRSRRSRMGPVAILLVLAVGLIGGLALYAGGADYIAGLFGDESEEPIENLTLVTERPGAENEVVDQSPTPGEMIVGEEEVDGAEDLLAAEDAPLPEEDIAAAERETRLAAEKKAAALKADALKADALRADALKREQEKQSEARQPEEQAGEIAPSVTASRYTAQVGATPDRKEAERIAAAVRAQGGSGVAITTAETDGVPVYRVRYGSFASEEEARRKSSAIGYGNVWVVNLR